MELHAVDDGVIVDRAGVCSASTKGLNVGLSRLSEFLAGDRRERQQLDLVDFDDHGTAPVDPSDLDLWSRPEAIRDGDGSIGYSIAKIRAELHAAILSRDADAEPAFWGTPLTSFGDACYVTRLRVSLAGAGMGESVVSFGSCRRCRRER
jgi:hypothetical protein